MSESILSTWGNFTSKSEALTTKSRLQQEGISPEKITIETENFQPRLSIQDTQGINNVKTGAITGAIFGFLIGLSISLVKTNFGSFGLQVWQNFQTIHYLYPILGSIIGAGGISVIVSISGVQAPKPNTISNQENLAKVYSVVVKGKATEIELAKKIIAQQGGVLKQEDKL